MQLVVEGSLLELSRLIREPLSDHLVGRVQYSYEAQDQSGVHKEDDVLKDLSAADKARVAA